ncbi:hypothetical protein VOLCADRAFT_91949 [Volvox carteri f. nagariensis]|uniref:Vacuolar protein sorting-associated protein n=1 Tax=Volvox carteri f. nagariensis TaxID=3068 RepID=D8TYD7_VOLCA|nr:uncharacterized protein VOLCADRAFT_91949 [Volvox carteri f. nagariensis]EFJ47536.1 hypothetical protein VOLCADRAFT_91949 [Volvox carteri f. nagariensis]|eukprot:XP_002951360.1 hypothetical protein VOLCADRAFT_91949 [Volvox carteri f. nagariensis]
MRRGPGIAGLQQAARTKEQFKLTGEEVKKNTLQAMHEQLAAFRTNLEEFARKHRADIRRDPVFRAQFHTMCANIGVDPLASNKSLWASTLGLGDYYYELGVQVRAIRKLRVLGGGFDLVTIGGSQYVRSVPGELNLDKNRALEVAQGKGFTSVAEMCKTAGWPAGRAEDVLQALTGEGIAWVDDGAPDGVRLFWFPCLGGGLDQAA